MKIKMKWIYDAHPKETKMTSNYPVRHSNLNYLISMGWSMQIRIYDGSDHGVS